MKVKNRNSAYLFLFIGIWFFPFVLSAQEFNLSSANTAEYWLFVGKDVDSINYKEHIENKLKLALSYGDLTLRGTFFTWNPAHPNPNRLNYIDYNLEYANDPINLLYGTYYSTLGRGLVLNQFLDEDFRNDNSIFGIKGAFNYLNSNLTILAGKPRNIFFEENNYKIKNDTTDQVRGVDFETRLIPNLTLAARYVRVNRRIDFTPNAFTELFGGNIGIQFGPYEGYLEYARHLGCYPVVGGRLTGNGLLFTSNLSLSGLGIAIQVMNYDSIGFGGANYRYNEPPTPIKSGVSVNRGTDEFGFGTSVNYTPIDNLNLEVNYNSIKNHDKTQGVLEQILKVKSTQFENLELIAAIEKTVKDQIELPIGKKTELKPSAEITYNLGEYFIEAGYDQDFVTADTSKYYDHALSVSIGKSELFQFTLRYERRNRTPDWLLNKLGSEKSWPMAELSLD